MDCVNEGFELGVTLVSRADEGRNVARAEGLCSVDGRYEVGPLLGRGGMGQVHVCKDQRSGRLLAMKTLSSLASCSVSRIVP